MARPDIQYSKYKIRFLRNKTVILVRSAFIACFLLIRVKKYIQCHIERNCECRLINVTVNRSKGWTMTVKRGAPKFEYHLTLNRMVIRLNTHRFPLSSFLILTGFLTFNTLKFIAFGKHSYPEWIVHECTNRSRTENS